MLLCINHNAVVSRMVQVDNKGDGWYVFPLKIHISLFIGYHDEQLSMKCLYHAIQVHRTVHLYNTFPYACKNMIGRAKLILGMVSLVLLAKSSRISGTEQGNYHR